MSSAQRVFITGSSAITASGLTLDATWNALMEGKTGIDTISQWDLSSWPHALGGELKDLKLAALLPDKKLLKLISRQDVLGIHAATKAVQASGMLAYRDSLTSAVEFNEETAVFVGSPGNKYYQQYDFLPLLSKSQGQMQPFAENLFSEVHPMWLLRILPNNVLAYTGVTYGFKGPNHNIANHAVGGMQALIEAYRAIQQGQASRAVVVAYDVGIEPQALYYYGKLGLISGQHLKPFDKQHDGTLLGEGAAALVLESEASVKARGAYCEAEVLAGLARTEAKGLFSIETEGSALTSLVSDTLMDANLSPDAIAMVVAHGNGNPKSDQTEAMAITRVFGDKSVPVTAFKWSMGHTLTPSGLLDAALTSKAFREHCIPGIANFEEPAVGAESLHLSASGQSLNKGAHALLINRGFASMNACLVMKACD